MNGISRIFKESAGHRTGTKIRERCGDGPKYRRRSLKKGAFLATIWDVGCTAVEMNEKDHMCQVAGTSFEGLPAAGELAY